MGSQYTLVVIDMQQGFPAARDAVLQQNVYQEICAAKASGCAIVFLEFVSVYPDYGTTFRMLAELVNGYARSTVVTKSDDDGSKQVIEACHQGSYTMKKFRLVGVNIDMCVLATAKGLVAELPQGRVVVVKEACNSMLSPAPWRGFSGLNHITVEVNAQLQQPTLATYASLNRTFSATF